MPSKMVTILHLFLLLCILLENARGFTNVYRGVKNCKSNERSDPGEPLFLTPLIESGKIEDARNKAVVQHKELGDVSSYAGFLTVNKEYNSNMFFWFFPATNNPRTAPVILWLEGGPGVTSLFGLLVETGPFIVTTNRTLQRRQYSWNVAHNVIYLDNPVGTGYSFTENEKGYATNETHIGRDVTIALVQFFKLFPELQTNQFYVVGESYAGKFVPAVSYAIKEYNVHAQPNINLQGLAIGNGFTDPINQIVYGDYLYQIGLIDRNGRDLFHQYEKRGYELLQQEKYAEASDLFSELLGGYQVASVFKNLTGFNFNFNYLHINDSTNWDDIVLWLIKPEIRRALHVGNYTFNAISSTVEGYLKNDIMRSVAHLVVDLLDHYKVLIYTGQLDIIVAYPYVENYLYNLKWSGADKYKSAQRKQWWIDNDLAGYTKTADNLTEVLVRNAGHMVPADQPQWALDLITRFTHNKQF